MIKENKQDRRIKSIKFIIGFVIGIFISVTTVYGVTIVGNGSNLTYDSSKVWLTSNNAQNALDELYNKGMTCPDGYICEKIKNSLAVGDYVSMTPTKTSYTTDTSKTGYTSTQTINPQELNLWRVISINDDGTVDMVSEYVSSTEIYFQGQTGYLNFVGYLNELSSQYENSTYTKGSRAFGYKNQTEYITDTSKFTTTPPWACSTGESCNPVESQGGGDTGYTKDYNLVKRIFGTVLGVTLNNETSYYWIASRNYGYVSTNTYYWQGRYVYDDESIVMSRLYSYSSGFSNISRGYKIRPVLILKSGLKYSGVGTIEHPMEISVS